MEGDFSLVTEDFVKLIVTSSSAKGYCPEKSFAKSLTIADLKGKLELMTGGNASTMQLTVFDKEGTKICDLTEDGALLGSYHIDSGMTLHVIDKFITSNEFDVDASNVPKFELSNEKYSQRTDTVRAHLERNKIGRFDPEREVQNKEEQEAIEALENQMAAQMKVGDRCEVQSAMAPRRGVIQFIGKVHFQKGLWVGVQLDEPVGKNDGSVGDQRYFTCAPKYGSFVKISNIKVGDYPEQDPFAEDEI